MRLPLVLVFGIAAIATFSRGATPICTGHKNGYYCGSSTEYFWCFGREAPASGKCNSPLVCKCGYTDTTPCVWSHTPVATCDGAPGSIFNSSSTPEKPPEETSDKEGGPTPTPSPSPAGKNDGTTPDGVYYVVPSDHLPLVLRFEPSTWKAQLQKVISGTDYDNAKLYSPAGAGYQCSFHPPGKYDKNPTQLWIGRPNDTITISYTPGVTIRLPDRYMALFLGYALDHYGLNPHMILSLGAKESFTGVIWKDKDDSYFIINDEKGHYDCYAPGHDGLCNDNNNDGPFQVETPAMSSDVSTFPQRFYTGDMSVAASKRKPSYVTDNELLVMPTFRAFHDSWTLDQGRAVVLTSLDFHFRHNILMKMRRTGMYDCWVKRTDRLKKDSLEFAAAMYTYNRGVFDTGMKDMFKKCGAEDDPADCGFDGYGGHTKNIREACVLLDATPPEQLYDYLVTWEDASYFLEKLKSTYPYESVDNFHPKIEWDSITKEFQEAFNLLQTHRQTKSGKKDAGISLRYDWRTLLAVVRMRLPSRELLAGPSVKNFVNYWGDEFCPAVDCFQKTAEFPYPFCQLAGGEKNLCSGDSPTPTPTPPSGSEEADKCPDDPNKGEPGKCGCGKPETDTDKDGTPDCVDLCPSDAKKTAPGNCGCGKVEASPCEGDTKECAPSECTAGLSTCLSTMTTPKNMCICVEVWQCCMVDKGCSQKVTPLNC